jgi:predicted HAD superfamily Cof-like phosphohydrolase
MSWIWHQDMEDMHDKFGVREAIKKMDKDTLRKFLKFRGECVQEEVDELHHAISGKDIDAEETVDALIDIIVFAIGTLDIFGVDANKAWNEVLNANLAKEVGIKKERPNPYGLPDLIKPAGWEAPSHENNHGILEEL